MPALSRKELTEPALRSQSLVAALASTGTLTGAIRIPDTIGHLNVTADLRASKVTCMVDVDAPREGRATTRVNWLVRQLKAAPDTLRVEAFAWHGRGAGATELLRDVREHPASLVSDPKRELRSFRLAVTTPLGGKRGRGRGSFIDSVLEAIDSFYADVMQNLKAWAPAPPRLREVGDLPPAPAALVSTALSSQDDPHDPGSTADSAHGRQATVTTTASRQDPPDRPDDPIALPADR